MFIVTKQIDSENISKVCRTCLREDNDKMICLFIGPAESSLGAKLQSLSCLEVSQGDGLPEKMCDRCVTRAESALLFREQCRAADQALRQAAARVSRAKLYADACKLYHQSQELVPLPYAENSARLTDCRNFSNSQDLYVPNHFPPSYYQREDNTPRQMHMVEPHNPYLNLSCYSTTPYSNDLFSNRVPSIVRADDFDPLTRHNAIYDRAPCALQCTLCNFTFSSSAQLESHSISHSIAHSISQSSDNADLSGDEINIEVEDDSNPLESTINYDRPVPQLYQHTVDDLSYNRMIPDYTSGYENLSYTNNVTDNHCEEVVNAEINTGVIQHGPNMNSCVESSEPTKLDKYKCDTCSRLFCSQSALAEHQPSHNRRKPFQCTHCEKSYSSKSKLTAHMKLHTQKNVHQCNICFKVFSYPSYLSDHMKTHSSKPVDKVPLFECTQCNKKFHFEKSYKRHMKFHTGKGLFHCDICDKLFSQKYSLKVHMRFHESSRIHQCNICDKSFNQRSNLVEHMRIHTKVKPFKCNICDKSFVQSSHLKSHELSHNSIRQHQCRICGKRFKLASHLKRHVNLHTGLKMFKCDQCDQMFAQAFSLKRHLKKHLESN